METIGNETNRSKRQAQETVTSLELKGYVKIVHRKTSKGINNVYTIQFPSSYQALNKVNTFTQLVATGKKAAKRGSAENRLTPATEGVSEVSAEFLLTPSAENRTTPSAENRTVNSSIESSSIETGTSTELRSEETPEDNQGQPLAETNATPGSSLGEVDKGVEISSGESLVEPSRVSDAPVSVPGDVVDAPASPTPGEPRRKQSGPRKKSSGTAHVPAPTKAATRPQGASYLANLRMQGQQHLEKTRLAEEETARRKAEFAAYTSAQTTEEVGA
jgi:hypothetical protein